MGQSMKEKWLKYMSYIDSANPKISLSISGDCIKFQWCDLYIHIQWNKQWKKSEKNTFYIDKAEINWNFINWASLGRRKLLYNSCWWEKYSIHSTLWSVLQNSGNIKCDKNKWKDG